MSELQRPSDFFSAIEIAQLRKVSDWRGAASIAHCWMVILATWVAVAFWTNPLTILLGVMIIHIKIKFLSGEIKHQSKSHMYFPKVQKIHH